MLSVRDLVTGAVELSKLGGLYTNPLEARVEFETDPDSYAALLPFEKDLPTIFKVSQVKMTKGDRQEKYINIGAFKAEGNKCARCWLIKEDVASNPAYEDLCARCAAVVADLEI